MLPLVLVNLLVKLPLILAILLDEIYHLLDWLYPIMLAILKCLTPISQYEVDLKQIQEPRSQALSELNLVLLTRLEVFIEEMMYSLIVVSNL
jgi:hypothetical protein